MLNKYFTPSPHVTNKKLNKFEYSQVIRLDLYICIIIFYRYVVILKIIIYDFIFFSTSSEGMDYQFVFFFFVIIIQRTVLIKIDEIV